MDFLVVPTVRFKLLYVWFVIEHGRRRVLHINVTAHPTSSWTIQQLREAFPDQPFPGHHAGGRFEGWHLHGKVIFCRVVKP